MQTNVSQGTKEQISQQITQPAFINPSAPRPETVPQPTYAPEAPTGTIAPNARVQEAMPQPQAPTQNSAEGYYQVSAPPPDTQPQPAIYNESAVAQQYPTQNSAENYYQVQQAQVDPRMAQAQTAMAIPSEPIKLTPQEFPTPTPTPEPVVVGADTSSSEFPKSSQGNLAQFTPTENQSQNFVDIEALRKEYDPVVIEAIHKIMGLAEIQLAEAGGDTRKEEAVINATTNSLTDVNRVVTGIRPQEEPAS